MKILRLCCAVLVVAACSESTTAPGPGPDVDARLSAEKADALKAIQSEAETLRTSDGPLLSHPAPVTYEGVLANTPLGIGLGQAGNVKFASIGESGDWDYWSFCAVAGSVIDIEVHRSTSAMDPASQVYIGTTPDAGGLFAFGGGNAFLSFVAFADDNNGIPHGVGGFFTDPRIVAVAPITGLYTLTVFDFIGAGPPDAGGGVPYEVHSSGLSVPAITVGSDTQRLWPPNHKMRTVVVSTSAAGGCGALSVSVSVSSDEPVNGTGDGDTAPDWSVTDNGDGTFDVELRAERAGGGDGRTYTITATATDATGASSSASVEVNVPHDKRK